MEVISHAYCWHEISFVALISFLYLFLLSVYMRHFFYISYKYMCKRPSAFRSAMDYVFDVSGPDSIANKSFIVHGSLCWCIQWHHSNVDVDAWRHQRHIAGKIRLGTLIIKTKNGHSLAEDILNAFSWMFTIWLKFYLSLFIMVWLTVRYHWCRYLLHWIPTVARCNSYSGDYCIVWRLTRLFHIPLKRKPNAYAMHKCDVIFVITML